MREILYYAITCLAAYLIAGCNVVIRGGTRCSLMARELQLHYIEINRSVRRVFRSITIEVRKQNEFVLCFVKFAEFFTLKLLSFFFNLKMFRNNSQ